MGSKGAYLKQMVQDKLIEHKQYIDMHVKICRKSGIGNGVILNKYNEY